MEIVHGNAFQFCNGSQSENVIHNGESCFKADFAETHLFSNARDSGAGEPCRPRGKQNPNKYAKCAFIF